VSEGSSADLGGEAPIFGGPLTAEAGAEDGGTRIVPDYDARADELAEPAETLVATPDSVATDETAPVPAPDPEREVDDWGRSERLVSAFDPVLAFYYRYWFRVEHEGSRTCRAAAARCWSPTTRGPCRRTDR
jgi:hypothetical protein